MVFSSSQSEDPCTGIDRCLEDSASVMPAASDRATAVRRTEDSGEPPGASAEDAAFRSLAGRSLVWPHVPSDENVRAAANQDHGERTGKRTRLFGFLYEMTVTLFNIVVWGLLALFALLTLIHG